MPMFDPANIQHPNSTEWFPTDHVAEYVTARLRTPLDKQCSSRLLSSALAPCVLLHAERIRVQARAVPPVGGREQTDACAPQAPYVWTRAVPLVVRVAQVDACSLPCGGGCARGRLPRTVSASRLGRVVADGGRQIPGGCSLRVRRVGALGAGSQFPAFTLGGRGWLDVPVRRNAPFRAGFLEWVFSCGW
ncbi:hypothetical protein NDU88_003329 [Pleurodeles waltl]|uniref:Uncharacterized protein n=1 Tax=Pleurodeles waltl TaxID=8319 RepID=A0AAV7MRC2_PLEWA|nr:hypothetical protein NDU88_003329 [Pleurodeles waltl]